MRWKLLTLGQKCHGKGKVLHEKDRKYVSVWERGVKKQAGNMSQIDKNVTNQVKGVGNDVTCDNTSTLGQGWM